MKLSKKVMGLGTVGAGLCVAGLGVYMFGMANKTDKRHTCSGFSCMVSESKLVSEVDDAAAMVTERDVKPQGPAPITQATVQLVHTHKEMDRQHYNNVANGCKKALKNCKKNKKGTTKSARNASHKKTVAA